MVARLAKNLDGQRRRATPAGAIGEGFDTRSTARAQAMPGAPRQALHSPRQRNYPIANEIDHLYDSLDAVTAESNPRTARLLESGTRKVAQKVIEEAGEVALAAVKHNGRGIVLESADLLYHLAVLWRRAGIAPADIWAEMRRRADSLGIAEKLPKSSS